jgi:multiple epidermal growth factor-like domains protein 10/11
VFEVCPEGYFGDHCLDPCECDNDNFICDPAKGCVCRVGFAGRDCLPPSAATVHDNEAAKEGGLGSAGAGVLVALLLVLLLVAAAVFYYRRQYKTKPDLPPVHYRVEKNPEGKPPYSMPELLKFIFVIFY